MYGMVNQAVKGLIEERFGPHVWSEIHQRAGTPATFVAMQPYDDAITYNLVAAASEVLGAPPEDILRTFGEHWVLGVATQHYGPLLSSTGQTFEEVVSHLDLMHERMRVTFPDYAPPSFRVKRQASGALQVDYYSAREGLLPFVEGLFSGLGKHFGLSVQLEHIPDDAHGLPCKRMLLVCAPAL